MGEALEQARAAGRRPFALVAAACATSTGLFDDVAAAADFAAAHGLAAGAGSDAHVASAIGAAYVEMPDFDGPASFLQSLRQGRVVGHHYDAPREWRPRVVPSTKAL
jgi:glutamate/tyrosine decarboxylase-like PLP-dependent enzyme